MESINDLNNHKWVFVTTNNKEEQTDLLENRNFFKFKSGDNYYGAKGQGINKGIKVSYDYIKNNNFYGTLTDKQLEELTLPSVDKQTFTDEELNQIENLLKKGGKRKSKKNKSKKSRKSKKNKTNKSRKFKKNKSKSYKK